MRTKFSLRQPALLKSTGRKVLMTLAVASIIGGSFIISASARDDDDGDGWRHDRNFSDHRGGEQHRGHRRGEWRGDRDGYGYRPQYRQPYNYSQPVYVPPPMYYEPRQSPGISLFFPLDLRH